MIPARYAQIVFSAIMATLMAFVMTFVITLLNTGMDSGFAGRWMVAFAVAAPIAFIAVMTVAPIAKRATAALTTPRVVRDGAGE